MYKIYLQQYLTPDKNIHPNKKADLLSFFRLIYSYILLIRNKTSIKLRNLRTFSPH